MEVVLWLEVTPARDTDTFWVLGILQSGQFEIERTLMGFVWHLSGLIERFGAPRAGLRDSSTPIDPRRV